MTGAGRPSLLERARASVRSAAPGRSSPGARRGASTVLRSLWPSPIRLLLPFAAFATAKTRQSGTIIAPGRAGTPCGGSEIGDSHFASPRASRRDRRTQPLGSAGTLPACTHGVGLRPAAGGTPALVWSAPPLQGRSCSGTQVRLHACIRPLRWEPRFPGPDGIRARLASTPRRPRTGPARAQARGMPVRPVLPSTSLLPRNHWRPHCRLESPRWGRIGGVGLGPRWH